MSDLLELAERCEKAEGADRELDCAIRMAVYAPAGSTMEESPINGNWCIYNGTDRHGRARLWESNLGRGVAFSASIDAAMSLVPAMPDYLFGLERDGSTWIARLDTRGDECGHGDTIIGTGRTAALALCNLALQARALASEEEKG